MGLSSQQMARMSRLLDEALTLDPAGRRAWLESLATDCQDLLPALREVLLEEQPSHSRPSPLDTPPKLGTNETMQAGEAADLQPGSRIGPYELIRPLGSGGMAEVWLARRADGAYRREVALKLPLVSRLRKDLEQRFVHERDILASLEHPNIARFYDAGVDSQGLPYLAMEYVPGQQLTVWCDAHRLAIPERLRLLLQVLEAVQYAHERRVIHRDLKPSNILVTESGQVRLLDFGVAKLLAADQLDHTQLTKAHGRALTPAYASPEMWQDEPVDARTDLYSLGVVLCELLSGARPDGQSAYPGVVEKPTDTPRMRYNPIAAAARATNPAALARALRGDLDAIVLKALARQPAERYGTAAEFAEDLQRHLQKQPVRARGATPGYRVWMFLRRHRAVVAAGTLAVAGLAGMAAYQRYRVALPQPALPADVSMVSAFAPPAHSIAVLPFTNLSGDRSQEYFSDGISEELINALTHINELQVTARTSSFSFKGQNVDISTIAHRLNVGAVLEGSVRRSGNTVRITAQLINATNGFHLWSQDYDRNLKDMLELQTDIATAVAGQLQARLLVDEAHNIVAGGTRNPQAYEAFLRGSELLTNWDMDDADLRAAVAAFDQSIALDPSFAQAYAKRATALLDMWMFASRQNQLADARDRALKDAGLAVALAPQFGEAHRVLATVLANGLFDFHAARPEFERAVALDPGDAHIQRSVAGFEGHLAHFEVAVAAARRAVSLDPQNLDTHITLGQVLTWARRYDEAITALQRAAALRPNAIFVKVNMANALLASGRFSEARHLCESSIPANVPARQFCFAIADYKLGRQTDAAAALELFDAAGGGHDDLEAAGVYAQWGDAQRALERLEKAEREHDPALQVLRVYWALDPVRANPRFKAAEERMNYPP